MNFYFYQKIQHDQDLNAWKAVFQYIKSIFLTAKNTYLDKNTPTAGD